MNQLEKLKPFKKKSFDLMTKLIVIYRVRSLEIQKEKGEKNNKQNQENDIQKNFKFNIDNFYH